MREDLLQPTLSGGASPASAPPSIQALFWTAFFGGPIAASASIAVCSQRLGRLTRDWPVLLALLAGSIAIVAWLEVYSSGTAFRAWMSEVFGRYGITYSVRATALAWFGIGYWLYRESHRSSELLGLKRPNGWLVAIPCILFGLAVTVCIAAIGAGPGVQQQ